MQLQQAPKPPQVTLSAIPNGRDGIAATLRAMREMVRQAKRADYKIRALALSLTGGLAPKNWIGEIKAIHEFCRDEIRYIKDIRGIETIHTPEKILELRQGDCDDKSILFCALAESIGHPTRFVAVGFTPGNFSHVFAETRIGNKWIASDSTENVPLGWRPPNIKNVMIAHN